MSAQKIKDGLGQVGSGLKEAAGNGVEWAIDGLLEFRRGKPSLLRVVTIPVGCLAVGVAFAVAGMVDEFGTLREDFKRAREEEEAAAAAATATDEASPEAGATVDVLVAAESDVVVPAASGDGTIPVLVDPDVHVSPSDVAAAGPGTIPVLVRVPASEGNEGGEGRKGGVEETAL